MWLRICRAKHEIYDTQPSEHVMVKPSEYVIVSTGLVVFLHHSLALPVWPKTSSHALRLPARKRVECRSRDLHQSLLVKLNQARAQYNGPESHHTPTFKPNAIEAVTPVRSPSSICWPISNAFCSQSTLALLQASCSMAFELLVTASAFNCSVIQVQVGGLHRSGGQSVSSACRFNESVHNEMLDSILWQRCAKDVHGASSH